ncbi:MAG: magnesium/cobalt transporter CorA [Thermoanaerobaculia bacterium]
MTPKKAGTPHKVGRPPGIELEELDRMGQAGGARARVTCIDFSPERSESRTVEDTESFLRGHRPDWVRVRWINVDGLEDARLIRGLAAKYALHPLAIEDLLTPNQRPKFEAFEAQGDLQARIFVVARMLQRTGGKLESEQISLFLGHNTVLTFQEAPGDIWDPLRQRIAAPASRMRQNDASFLLYCLLDAIIDNCFPVLEQYGERLEELEEIILDKPSKSAMQEIHALKRELLVLRRAIWPMREVVLGLQREEHECVSPTTRTYLRDAADHAIHIMDILETYREIATSLTEAYMTSLGIRTNDVMKVLTIIGTIFIPLTFLAGVYGMNMPIPENQWHVSYPVFWLVCLVVAGAMVAWFRRRGWF